MAYNTQADFIQVAGAVADGAVATTHVLLGHSVVTRSQTERITYDDTTAKKHVVVPVDGQYRVVAYGAITNAAAADDLQFHIKKGTTAAAAEAGTTPELSFGMAAVGADVLISSSAEIILNLKANDAISLWYSSPLNDTLALAGRLIVERIG